MHCGQLRPPVSLWPRRHILVVILKTSAACERFTVPSLNQSIAATALHVVSAVSPVRPLWLPSPLVAVCLLLVRAVDLSEAANCTLESLEWFQPCLVDRRHTVPSGLHVAEATLAVEEASCPRQLFTIDDHAFHAVILQRGSDIDKSKRAGSMGPALRRDEM